MDNQDRSRLIEDIMKQLKLQADRKRDQIFRRSLTINPQILTTTNPSVYGPFYFETPYSKNPNVAFGQARLQSSGITGVLIVQPYVDSWVLKSGQIDGFNLGVYALTPVPSNLTSHLITMVAVGKASAYKADKKYDTWRAAYDTKLASHLYASDGELEKLQ